MTLRRRLAGTLLGVAASALGGCGNAVQHLEMGEWREVGRAEPPIVPEDMAFKVTTVTPGESTTVSAGDLIQARVTVTTVDMTGGTGSNPPPQVLWVWTGRTPLPSTFSPDNKTYGSVGSDALRATFVGRHLHEQFNIEPVEAGPHPRSGYLPLRVFSEARFARMEVVATVNGKLVEPLRWPDMPLSGTGGGRPTATIEILAICPGARLYRRSAVLTQDGAVFTTGDNQYNKHRSGVLGWSALEAQCPGPDGPMRFQAGPFNDWELQDPHRLANWANSYKELRPAEAHPEEWQKPRPQS